MAKILIAEDDTKSRGLLYQHSCISKALSEE